MRLEHSAAKKSEEISPGDDSNKEEPSGEACSSEVDPDAKGKHLKFVMAGAY